MIDKNKINEALTTAEKLLEELKLANREAQKENSYSSKVDRHLTLALNYALDIEEILEEVIEW